MVEEHLNYLKQIREDEKSYIGNNSLAWANTVVDKNRKIDSYLNRKFTRYDLFDYCANEEIDNFNILIAILSWGGMRRDHGRRIFSNINYLDPIIERLRNKAYRSREEAFDAFQQLRNQGLLPGLGIGYFTKLICFLSPNLNGYIMDIWVGKSINLLTDSKLVKISNGSWVNDQNKAETYELFCHQIDILSGILNCNGFAAEEKIFSIGYGKGQWRKYLISNYK